MKVKRISNYRVEVTPDPPRSPREDSHQWYRDRLATLVKEILRHVDGIDLVQAAWDSYEFCEHCGELWECCIADPVTGEPGCCDKAVQEWESQHPKLESPHD